MSVKTHQMQWRNHPDGAWTYHSPVEPDAAKEQAFNYMAKHGEKRAFDYRVVCKDSPDALVPAPQFETKSTTI